MVRLEDPERLVDAVPPPEDGDPDVEFEEAKMMDDSVGSAAPMGAMDVSAAPTFKTRSAPKRAKKSEARLRRKYEAAAAGVQTFSDPPRRTCAWRTTAPKVSARHGCRVVRPLPITPPDNLTPVMVILYGCRHTQFGKR